MVLLLCLGFANRGSLLSQLISRERDRHLHIVSVIACNELMVPLHVIIAQHEFGIFKHNLTFEKEDVTSVWLGMTSQALFILSWEENC